MGIFGSNKTLDQIAHYAEGANLTVTVMQAQNDLEAAHWQQQFDRAMDAIENDIARRQ